MTRVILLVFLATFISACSNKKYCEREQEFQQVSEGQPLVAPEGLEVPERDPSYVIPQVSTQAQAAALNSARPCLELPPRLRSETTIEEES